MMPLALGVIVDKRDPSLFWIGRTLGRLGYVTPDGAQRNPDANLEQQLTQKQIFRQRRWLWA